jgi:hypothetical protein
VRAGELDGRKIYVIPLESDGLAPTMVSVGAETGDVLQDQRTLVFPGVGNVPTTTYADYRLLSGRRVPYRYVESTEMSGRTIYQVERVEVGVELNPSTFTLQP